MSLFIFSIRHTIIQYPNNRIVQLIITVIILFLSFSITNVYLIISKKENNLLLSLMSRSKLRNIKQFQALLTNLFIFIILSIFCIIPTSKHQLLVLFVVIIILILLALFQGMISLYNPTITSQINKNNKFNHSYNFIVSLTIQSLIIRDILFIWRKNRPKLFLYIFMLLLINLLILSVSNRNDLINLYRVGFFIQSSVILRYIFSFPSENDLNFLRLYPTYSFKTLISEFIFWIGFTLIYFGFLSALYFFFLHNISPHFLLIFFLIHLFLICYIILIRLAYLESKALRIISFLLIVLPLTIPFVVYNCIRRLKC